MRYRIILADENHARIARQGFTRVIEREEVTKGRWTELSVEAELQRLGELPEGYRVALVREVT